MARSNTSNSFTSGGGRTTHHHNNHSTSKTRNDMDVHSSHHSESSRLSHSHRRRRDDEDRSQVRSTTSGDSSHGERNRSGTRQKCGIIVAIVFAVLVTITVSVTVTQLRQERNSKNGINSGSTQGNNSATNPNSPLSASPPSPAASVPSASPTTTGFMACNGLESLCDVRVNDVLFATLHNAISTQADGTFVFANHALSLEDALEAGWRGLNFDVGKCAASAYPDQPIRLVHGTCLLGTRDPVQVFANIFSFLQKHRNEVLILPLQIDNTLDGGAVTLMELYNVMAQSGGNSSGSSVANLTSWLYQHPGTDAPWPTLRELIEANTRLLLFHYNGGDDSCMNTLSSSSTDSSTCPRGFHEWFTYATETEYSFATVAAVRNTNASCALTRGERGTRHFSGINIFTSIPSTTSCEQLNAASFVRDHIENCTEYWDLSNTQLQQREQRPSLILADCWDVGGILSVVEAFNKLLVAPTIRSASVIIYVDGIPNDDKSLAVKGSDQAVLFLSTCSSFFAEQLSNRAPQDQQLYNIYCRNMTAQQLPSQTRALFRSRRQQDAQTTWKITVVVQGDDIDGSSTLKTSELESIVDASSDFLVQSLSLQDSYFSSVTQITIAVPASQNTSSPMTTAPVEVSSVPPTIMASTAIPSVTPTLALQNTTMPTIVLEVAATVPPTMAPTNATLTPTTGGPNVAPTAAAANVSTPLCNGFANLCDLPVNAILFATVHNAASTVEDGVTLFPNHERSFDEALVAGYRGINVDIGKCDNEVQLVHGFCGLGSVDPVMAFASIVNFLQTNPNEVILMPTQIDAATGGIVTLEEIDAIMESVAGFKDLMYSHNVSSDSTPTPWPTLRELIAVNTRILFFFYNGDRQCADATSNCPTGFHDWFQFSGESQYQFDVEEQVLDDKAYACEITRGDEGLLQFYGVNVFLTLPTESSCLALNDDQILSAHIEACAMITGRAVNLLIVDCWDVGGVLDVANAYNSGL